MDIDFGDYKKWPMKVTYFGLKMGRVLGSDRFLSPPSPGEAMGTVCVPLLFSQAFLAKRSLSFGISNASLPRQDRGVHVQVCSLRRKLLVLGIIAILTELQCEAKNMFSLLHRRSNRVSSKN